MTENNENPLTGKLKKPTPIKKLDPYNKNWFIQCRVTWKSKIRHWGEDNQDKLFNATLTDSEGSEIKTIFFRDSVDQFFNFLEVGKIYDFSNGQVQFANQAYLSHDCPFEITFNANALISVSKKQHTIIKDLYIKPIEIAKIIKEVPKFADVCSIVIQQGKLQTFTSKAGNNVTKYEFYLGDDSNHIIKCTGFGDKAIEIMSLFDKNKSTTEPIVCAIKGAKTNDYYGCSLTLQQSTQIYINPDIEKAKQLLAWTKTDNNLEQLKSKISTINSVPIGKRKTCEYINELQDISTENVEYATIKGTISNINKKI